MANTNRGRSKLVHSASAAVEPLEGRTLLTSVAANGTSDIATGGGPMTLGAGINDAKSSPTLTTTADSGYTLRATDRALSPAINGPSAGNFDWEVVFANENDATGAFTDTGNIFDHSGAEAFFSASGAISTKGVLTATGTFNPVGVFGVVHDKAKLVGNMLKGTYSNAFDSGTFTLTRQG